MTAEGVADDMRDFVTSRAADVALADADAVSVVLPESHTARDVGEDGHVPARDIAMARARALKDAESLAGSGRSQRASRALDIALCLLAAPLAIVAGLLVALLIKCVDGGPVFFVQQRTGLNGRRFRMYKFRTMVPNAEELKKELERLSVVSYPVFKVRNDPRLTRTGRYLRRSFLDELPQLLNVLKGDMSIVGPRPTAAPPSDYLLWQTARLDGRPGLTGLWQTTPNSEDLEFPDRVRLDIRYLSGRSVAWDIRLIGRTIRRCLGRMGL